LLPRANALDDAELERWCLLDHEIKFPHVNERPTAEVLAGLACLSQYAARRWSASSPTPTTLAQGPAAGGAAAVPCG